MRKCKRCKIEYHGYAPMKECGEMSDTPRTDEFENRYFESGTHVDEVFVYARLLERELAAALEQRDKTREWVRGTLGTAHLKEMHEFIAENRRLIEDHDLANTQRELAAAQASADAMDEFLGAAAKREKEASAIIKSLTADINITVPIRDYTEMSPVDCYELGMMDGVAALKSQIHAAVDAAPEWFFHSVRD
jgi:hypothetical protein